MQVKFKKTHHAAKTPTYGTSGAACFDFYATERAIVHPKSKSDLLDTGIAFEIPEGYVMLAYSRSGHGFKNGIRLCNSVGVIDSDYRDSVKVRLVNDSYVPFEIAPGDRILQAMIIPVPTIELIEDDVLSDTERGLGGLGSTGK